ncbi:hypothetical protein DPMN_172920 [Dreissena polymorpha]|uniref:Uncharacterized protein n=1 Tax=Dreissena polymorpha TaxID=45954 RepID=A0A9D4E0M9_DREPO|nr:hypothetical protein DPMN_172920 [Dreissena polymorpha]
MGDESRLREETGLPRDRPNYTEAGHSDMVHQTQDAGDNSPQLTVPRESRCDMAYERKKAKYTDLSSAVPAVEKHGSSDRNSRQRFSPTITVDNA